VLAGCGTNLEPGAVTSTQGINKGVFPPDIMPAGKSYGEWSAAWWQWYIACPASTHPYYNDQTGVNAGVNQSGPVWFLVGGGKGTERTCTIPAARLILFPISNTCFMFTSPTDTMAAAHAANEDSLKHVMYMEASVDGVPLTNLGSYRFESPGVFDTNQDPVDPIWPFLPPGPYPTVALGYWIMLEPLPAGQHTIYFRADTAWEEPTGQVKREIAQQVTYHITVE